MKPIEDQEIKVIAEQILKYLEDHPNAADSVKGISDWWLHKQWRMDKSEKIEKALDYLTVQGNIYKTVIPNGDVIYSKKHKA